MKKKNTDKNYWYSIGREDLQRALNQQPNLRIAKNIIFFLGDGMGVSTVTAARIHAGQKNGQPGEENFLNFEKFPYLGLLKVLFYITEYSYFFQMLLNKTYLGGNTDLQCR